MLLFVTSEIQRHPLPSIIQQYRNVPFVRCSPGHIILNPWLPLRMFAISQLPLLLLPYTNTLRGSTMSHDSHSENIVILM